MVGIKNSGVKKRNLIIFFLCLAVFAMAIAYTVSGSILKINGVSAVTSRWDVRITNIKTAEVIGMARDQQEPTFSNFEASFSTLLSLPGDSMTYDVTVTNNGTLDAVIDDITLNTTNNPAIEFSISGIEKGDRLNAGASDVLKVKVLYKNKEALVGDNLVSSFSIVFNYIQASNYSSSKDTVCFDTTAVDDNSVTITNYYSENDGCGTSVKIPDFIDGKRVVAIDDKAFYSKNLIGVIIPSSVKTIGSNAFAKNEISLLELAEGLTNIAYGTFSDNKLTTVTIPSSVKSIGIRAFANNKINNLNFSKNLSNIDDMAFMNNNLVTIDLNTVQLIGAKAFANNKITSLVIPDSVMSLGEGAFANNVIESVNIGKQVKTLNKDVFISNKITSIVIPDNVTFLASSALENNPLENIALGTGIKEIKDNQFNGYSLKAITINGPITKIGDNAFYKNNLTDIVIPYTVTKIGSSAFYGNKLTDVNIPSSVKVIGSSAFAFNEISSLTLPSSLESIEYYTFGHNLLTDVNIPFNVKRIDSFAFTSNKLENVIIPSSIVTIESSAFSDNDTLKTISINKPEGSISGAPFGADGAKVIWSK